ncbi:MAG TPA: nucleotidyltransferase domain-containing protein [Myxococcota bacterium]|jgi:predicted nucleotidyltransferase
MTRARANKTVPPASVLAILPIAVRSRVEELVAGLQQALGSELKSVIAFGSAVRGGFDPAHSDVDLVIALQHDLPELLDKIGPLLRMARAAARVECVILLHDEIEHAADVFPLMYDDIRACRSILFGDDPFATLFVADEHRRLRIEQELRDARIRLRRIVAGEGLAGPALGGAVAARIKLLRSPLHALFDLVGKEIKDDLTTVLRVAGDRWGADASALLSPTRDAVAALRALRRVLDGAVDEVDALQVAR